MITTSTTVAPVQISQSDLLNFAVSSGIAQQNTVREVKTRPDYDPRADYYKRLRDSIARMHRLEQPLTVLDQLCAIVPDKKKERYRAAVAVYKRFLKGKTIEWFAPREGLWQYGGLIVKINPELGLNINGTPYVIKLYFRDEPLTKAKIAGIIHLMEKQLHTYHSDDTVFSILDVQNNKLLTNRGYRQDLMPLIRGYASAFMQIYNDL